MIALLQFVFLAALYLLSSPRQGIDWRQVILVAALVYIVHTSPNLLRNFLLNRYDSSDPIPIRTVFAWVHWDIDKIGCLLQEAQTFTIILLYSLMWKLWFVHLSVGRFAVGQQQTTSKAIAMLDNAFWLVGITGANT